jgi:hypothetical protein
VAQSLKRAARAGSALAALVDGAIDYAGTFPPARLPLGQAAANYLRYRTSADARWLGRFVCSATQLAALPATFSALAKQGGGVSVTVDPVAEADGPDRDDRLARTVDAALDAVRRSPSAAAVDVLELRWPPQVADLGKSELGNTVQFTAGYVADAGLGRATLYFELPTTEAAGRRETVRSAAAALADYNRSAGERGCAAGLKVRTGGLTADAVPTPEQLAEFVAACRDAGLFWKATAGLHQPLRHFDVGIGATVHGFVNLFAATALAAEHELTTDEIAEILREERADRFRFTTDELTWNGRTVGVERIAAVRRSGLRSFGSCSFTEPCDGLNTWFL